MVSRRRPVFLVRLFSFLAVALAYRVCSTLSSCPTRLQETGRNVGRSLLQIVRLEVGEITVQTDYTKEREPHRLTGKQGTTAGDHSGPWQTGAQDPWAALGVLGRFPKAPNAEQQAGKQAGPRDGPSKLGRRGMVDPSLQGPSIDHPESSSARTDEHRITVRLQRKG
jgi:hypothetical protein